MNLIQREIDIWKVLKNPYLIELFEVLNQNQEMYLISEFCKNGNLLTYINHSKQGLDENIAKYLFSIFKYLYLEQIAQGLDYLHNEMRIVHRNENIYM